MEQTLMDFKTLIGARRLTVAAAAVLAATLAAAGTAADGD
jgi:hypothetical protein